MKKPIFSINGEDYSYLFAGTKEFDMDVKRVRTHTPELYSGRKKLAEMFKKWATENGIENCPENVIAYLVIHGLINCEKAVWFMEGQKDG